MLAGVTAAAPPSIHMDEVAGWDERRKERKECVMCVYKFCFMGRRSEVWRQACRRRCFACGHRRRRWEEPRERRGSGERKVRKRRKMKNEGRGQTFLRKKMGKRRVWFGEIRGFSDDL